METVIMKFGGAAVARPEQYAQIAEIIGLKLKTSRVVVVVSAMGDATDQLFSLARLVHPSPPPRELDMLVSTGERVSIALLAMALQLKGIEALSFTGSQSGIITSSCHSQARIVDVRPRRLIPPLEEGKVVIVAGFQGVSVGGEITTLGRGGSDTTAVALGVALGAQCVEFYKDVFGICAQDPKSHPSAEVLPFLTYREALGIVAQGAKVLHGRCIELAEKNHLKLHVRSFFDAQLERSTGTWIHGEGGASSRGCIYEDEFSFA